MERQSPEPPAKQGRLWRRRLKEHQQPPQEGETAFVASMTESPIALVLQTFLLER